MSSPPLCQIQNSSPWSSIAQSTRSSSLKRSAKRRARVAWSLSRDHGSAGLTACLKESWTSAMKRRSARSVG
jgi:hypothetical protein